MAPLPLTNDLKEDNLTDECKHLLPNLPFEECFISRLYLYRGFWFTPAHLNGLLSYTNYFHPLDDDVILASMPKSGTTWLKAILSVLSHRAMGEDSSGQHAPLLTTNPHDLVPFLEIMLYVNNPNPDLSSFTSPRIFGTHVSFSLLPHSIRDSKCKVVYICRNVKDNFTSFWHFTNKFRPKEISEIPLGEIFDMFSRGVNIFGPYWDHLLGYWKASLETPEKVLFIKYEDIKERPVKYIKILARFIGRPVDDDTANDIMKMCSFESLSKLEVNKNGKLSTGEENKVFFRKGEVGDWKNLLSLEMADKLDRITEEKLYGSGLKI